MSSAGEVAETHRLLAEGPDMGRLIVSSLTASHMRARVHSVVGARDYVTLSFRPVRTDGTARKTPTS